MQFSILLNNFKRTARGLAVALLASTLLPFNSYAGSWGDFISGALDSYSKQLDREIEIDRQVEAEKKLLEYRYELEQKRLEAQREREALRHEQERKARLVADEQHKREAEENRKRALSTGTGFFVAPNGYIITNHHVIEEKSHYAVRDLQGNFYRATVVAQDANRDLALLKVAGSFPSLKIVRPESVSKGQRVMAVGYPQISIQGNESKVTDGVISSFTGLNNDSNWFQISTPIQGGNSGGPLVTESGHVVGVVVATANAAKFFKITGNIPQNVNYAIKSNVLLGFLAEQNVANVASSYAKTSIENVDRATVLVIAKGGPIDVSFALPPEQRAENDKERAKALVEEARRLKAQQEAERKAQAQAITEAARQRKEQLHADQREKEESARIEKRDREIAKSFPDWKNTQQSELFSVWLKAQSIDSQSRMTSIKAADVISVLKQFQSERKGFSEGYFQGMGTWIADKNGCRFLTHKLEPKATIIWSGKCEEGRGTGDGELIWLSDNQPIQKQTGTFKHGMFNGFGRWEVVADNGAFREGNFKNGKLEGHGKAHDKSGKIYEGEHKQGKQDGQGKLTSEDVTIIGQFKDGRPNGYSKFSWQSGSSYEGNVKDGKYDGQGRHFGTGGASYVGTFKDGKFEGRGRKTYKDGTVYDGEFRAGKEDGTGTYTSLDGQTKTVQMSEGKQVKQ